MGVTPAEDEGGQLIWQLPAGEPVLSEIRTNSVSVFSSVFWVRLKRSGSLAQLCLKYFYQAVIVKFISVNFWPHAPAAAVAVRGG